MRYTAHKDIPDHYDRQEKDLPPLIPGPSVNVPVKEPSTVTLKDEWIV